MQRLILIDGSTLQLVRVKYAELLVVLGTFSTNLDLAVTLSFEFLLGGSRWSNNLSDVVYGGVVGFGDEDFPLLFRWFVVWRGLVCLVESEYLVNEPQPLLVISVFQPLVPCIASLPSFRVIDGLRTGRPDIAIICLIILLGNASLQIVDSMPTRPYLDVK